MRTPTAWHQHGTNMAPTWQQPINAEAKKQLEQEQVELMNKYGLQKFNELFEVTA